MSSKEGKIKQGKELLEKNHFTEAETLFQSIINSGETDSDILELKGDSLRGQHRNGYSQKCYKEALEGIMTEIYDNVKDGEENNLNELQPKYEKIYQKIENIDLRLYPPYEELIIQIRNNDHPRLLDSLKLELENPAFTIRSCGDYFTIKRNYEEHMDDDLSRAIYRNKSANVSDYISQRMAKQVQKHNIDIDLVVPVPNHESDSQDCKAISIANNLVQRIGKPVLVNALIKQEKSDDNRRSSGRYYRKSVAEKQYAIGNTNGITNKKILLVDDVLVTRATVEKCGKLLMDNGARKVEILCAGESFYEPI